MTLNVWDRICEYQFAFRILSILIFCLALLTLFSFPFLEPGSAEYVIAMYNVVVLTAFIAVIIAFRFKCNS